MREIAEGTARVLRILGAIVLLSCCLIGCGVVRQAMSFSECAPGKPEMSLSAFVLAGFGGSVCIVPPRSAR